jgi:quinohemoprotein ethanol dehydrogenase
MKIRYRIAGMTALFSCLFVLSACQKEAAEVPEEAGAVEAAPEQFVVDDAALADDSSGENWLAYGRTFSEQRFSPLSQINIGNITELGVDWFIDLPNARSLPGTPLVVDGVMYFEEFYNVVHAVNAATGEQLWEYDPKVIEHAGDRMRVMWDYSRGLAFWKGKVFTATMDGRLIALDAETGQPLWSVMTLDVNLPLYITGAPKVFKGKVVIGNGGTEMGAIRGYLTAYDVDTGQQAWRFYTVPGDPAYGFENEAMAMAAETWTGEWWKFGGGGTVWNGITYDPEFDKLYIGTGNGSPWNRKIRSPGGGDNLFLSSIVALDPDTGAYQWHYQTVPGESWDYNSNMDIVLADLEIGGRTVKALMHAPKNGFFYVIDRETGKLLSAEPFSHVTWATHVDIETGRPVESPGARYEDNYEEVFPSAYGAHSWHPMSYNPDTGLVYIPAIDLGMPYEDRGMDLEAWESPDWSFDPGVVVFTGDAPADAGTSTLKAWDPVTQKLVWEVPNPGVWNAGTLTTAGNLVFQGQASGELVAYAADTGQVMWKRGLGLGISAPPVSYSIDGKQYVSLLVGWGGAAVSMGGTLAAQHGWAYKAQPRRLVTFALGGATELPANPPPVIPQPLAAPDFAVDDALVARGAEIFPGTCSLCHGPVAVSGGAAPDLRASPVVLSEEAFADVLSGGSRRAMGMPAYPEMTADDLLALRHYIRAQVAQ